MNSEQQWLQYMTKSAKTSVCIEEGLMKATTSWEAIGNWWLLGEGELVLFRDYIPWGATHLRGYPCLSRWLYRHTYMWHKGYSMSFFFLMHMKLGNKRVWGLGRSWREGKGGKVDQMHCIYEWDSQTIKEKGKQMYRYWLNRLIKANNLDGQES